MSTYKYIYMFTLVTTRIVWILSTIEGRKTPEQTKIAFIKILAEFILSNGHITNLTILLNQTISRRKINLTVQNLDFYLNEL